MGNNESQTALIHRPRPDIPNLRCFTHNAMAAPFEVFIIHEDARFAEQAAWAAFDEIDRLEAALSRFSDNSDVSRINSLARGRPLQIGPAAFECLKISVEMYNQTAGAFDVTIGPLYACWLNKDRTLRRPSQKEIDLARSRTGTNLIRLNESDHTIELTTDGVRIDLGAIGKGFAADKMRELFADWGVDVALVSAGQSSILPIGRPAGLPGWPVSISHPSNLGQILAELHLSNRSLSASGLRKGPHIIDPRSGRPVEGKLATWATAPTAAAADALSTAFMVMSPAEVESFCSTHPDSSALLVLQADDKNPQPPILHFGLWPALS